MTKISEDGVLEVDGLIISCRWIGAGPWLGALPHSFELAPIVGIPDAIDVFG